MAKHTLKILQCEHRVSKYVWPFYNIMYEMVKVIRKPGLSKVPGDDNIGIHVSKLSLKVIFKLSEMTLKIAFK